MGQALGGALSEPVLSRQDAVLTAMTAWEAQNLRTLREREQALRERERELLLTYTREDAYNAVGGCAPSRWTPSDLCSVLRESHRVILQLPVGSPLLVLPAPEVVVGAASLSLV